MIDWPAILSTLLRRRTRCHRRVSTAFFLRVGLARYGCRTSHPEADNAGRSGSRSCRGWFGHCRAGGFGDVTPALLGPHCQGASARAADTAFPAMGLPHPDRGGGRQGPERSRHEAAGLGLDAADFPFPRLIAFVVRAGIPCGSPRPGARNSRQAASSGRSVAARPLRRHLQKATPCAASLSSTVPAQMMPRQSARSVSQRRRGAVASSSRGDGSSLVRHPGRGEGGQGAGRPPRKGAASKLPQAPRQDRHLRGAGHGFLNDASPVSSGTDCAAGDVQGSPVALAVIVFRRGCPRYAGSRSQAP